MPDRDLIAAIVELDAQLTQAREQARAAHGTARAWRVEAARLADLVERQAAELVARDRLTGVDLPNLATAPAPGQAAAPIRAADDLTGRRRQEDLSFDPLAGQVETGKSDASGPQKANITV